MAEISTHSFCEEMHIIILKKEIYKTCRLIKIADVLDVDKNLAAKGLGCTKPRHSKQTRVRMRTPTLRGLKKQYN